MLKSKHTKQKIWQIYIPLIISVLIVILIAIFFTLPQYSKNISIRTWVDISIIWIILPLMICSLIVFGVIVTFCYITAKANAFFYTKLPPTIEKYTNITKQINGLISKAISPVINISSWLSTIIKSKS